VANNSMRRGFVPVSTNGQNVPTCSRPKKVSSAAALYVYSPVVVAAGAVDSVAADSANSDMSGSIVALLDSTGASVETLAAGDAGTCIMTYLPDQVFQAVVVGTDYAAADNGITTYLIPAEGGTSAPYSDRRIGAGATTTGQVIAAGIVKRPDNAYATASCEAYVMTNPVNFKPA
jgi:hypothetical protein